MKINIGYLEGTDPLILSRCAALGINTIPLSNGWDNHGKYIGLLSKTDNVSLVIAYLHKLIAPPEMETKPGDFLNACKIHRIPVLVICHEKMIAQAKKKLSGVKAKLYWVTPATFFDTVMKILKMK
ncbi:hypothetical protein CH330_05035 [candidate division WOR-3 bacterium JGI_Cruoil_03_51_56]|uniref:DUF5615 domain-containing protein n=1 Tax=candidate division WOR-3 bacterium JGI_Cruoil_03_51_56 TaxID=1973747 RepID=A0A235BTV9_UNCW3|nr:MAG: hypothetical protein CH330_05035 [candidate division WOR-3 bacterium JGI_Cruoil_03_51_56]